MLRQGQERVPYVRYRRLLGEFTPPRVWIRPKTIYAPFRELRIITGCWESFMQI